MPLRPDLSIGLNSPRPTATPVRLPTLSFPMVGGVPETTSPSPDSLRLMDAGGGETMTQSAPADMGAESTPVAASGEPGAAPAPASTSARILVYGRSGCPACLSAIQDLIDRQVSFIYYDITRDSTALQHVQAICGGAAMVPVIVEIGYSGAV